MDIRELVGGALDNHKFYLKCIAIPNCNEFFDFYDSDFRKFYIIAGEFDRYVCVRKFLIAVESMNNIFDYMYHEFCQGFEGLVAKNIFNMDEKIFKKNALKLIGLDCVRDVVDMANAYKHSRRNSQNYKVSNAKDLIERRRFDIDVDRCELNYLDGGFYLPIKSQVVALRESLAFWSDYCSGRASVSRKALESLLR